MPHNIQWYIQGQVLCGELWGEQTLEELVESNAKITECLDSADGRLIHVILDDSKLEVLPVSIFQVQKVLTYAKHPNLGWVTMVGVKENSVKGSAGDFLITLLAKITRARYHRLKTFNEAVEFLKSADSTIDWNAAEPGIASQSATK